MFGFCGNIPYDTNSITQSNQLKHQITISNSSKHKNLEEISFRIFKKNKKLGIEYSIKEEVLTKSERNLENMNNEYYKKYNSIIIDGKKIFLTKPVILLVEQNNDGYFFLNKDINIIAGGKSFEEAEQNMYEEFLIQWELYADEKDENLTTKAQLIKKNLLESVKL